MESNTVRSVNDDVTGQNGPSKKENHILKRLTPLSKRTWSDFVCTEHPGVTTRHYEGEVLSYSSIWLRQ